MVANCAQRVLKETLGVKLDVEWELVANCVQRVLERMSMGEEVLGSMTDFGSLVMVDPIFLKNLVSAFVESGAEVFNTSGLKVEPGS